MNKLKLFFSLLMLITFSMGNVWAAVTLTPVAASDLQSGQRYLISAKSGNVEYYLRPLTFSAGGGTAVVVNTNNITTDSTWLFTSSNGTWTISVTSGTGLYFTNANNGATCAANQGAAFTIVATATNASTCYLSASDGSNVRYLSLYTSTPNFRSYKNTGKNGSFSVSGIPEIQLYSVSTSGGGGGGSSNPTLFLEPFLALISFSVS